MAFGLSFGSKKKTTTGSALVDKATTTDSQQTQQQAQSTTGTTSGSTTGTNQSSGASSTSGTQQQSTSQQQVNQQNQQQTSFSDGVLTSLEAQVQNLLGSGGRGAGKETAESALAGLNGFDSEGYVNGIVANARNRSEADRQQAIATAENVIGGTVSSNSAAALLASRINNDANASLAGVESDAVAKAQAILQSNAQVGTTVQNSDNQLLTQLADILKGGVTTGASTGVSTGTGTTNTAQAQNTNTNEVSQQAQQSDQRTQTDVLSELITLLKGTEKTKGSELTTNTEKPSGFGISI